ncbi:MAG TPA: hypothetical protein PLJ87_07830 [Anaerolineaceae bacterium]|nr:hypothetical protein [Anaerolineaceae bacterium]HOR83722.1 hypothetical protein [Anaerolineaceae bacterium]
MNRKPSLSHRLTVQSEAPRRAGILTATQRIHNLQVESSKVFRSFYSFSGLVIDKYVTCRLPGILQ